MCSCSLFCFQLPLIFTLVAASISHIVTAAIRFSCFSSNEIGLLFFISRFSSFSVFHVDVHIKIKSKERLGFIVFFFFSLKVQLAMRFCCTSFLSLPFNNFYCDILHLYNIAIPIINSVISVTLVWPAEILLRKNNTRCSDQLCSSLWTSRFWFLVF